MSENGICEYGGNKVFNYGFMSGSSGYCRHPRGNRFLSDMDKCPKSHDEAPQNKKALDNENDS